MKKTLRLTVDVTYDIQEQTRDAKATLATLVAALQFLPGLAASEGMFTGSMEDAEVDAWESSVEEVVSYGKVRKDYTFPKKEG